MRRTTPLALALTGALAATLALAGCAKDGDNDVFGQRVRAYLLKHPEILIEMSQKLHEKQEAEVSAMAAPAIRAHRQALEHDSRDFVANPNGKYTVVEFFDYRCPHCVNVAPQVLALIRDNPDVRFVFKETPIFGAPSERAARAALYAQRKGGDYLGIYHDMMSARPLDEAAIRRIMTAHGLDPDASEAPAMKAELNAHLADTATLSGAVGMTGTPHFIIGDQSIVGENMPGVTAAIKALREGKK